MMRLVIKYTIRQFWAVLRLLRGSVCPRIPLYPVLTYKLMGRIELYWIRFSSYITRDLNKDTSWFDMSGDDFRKTKFDMREVDI